MNSVFPALIAVTVGLAPALSRAEDISPCTIKQTPASFDHKSLSLHGAVSELKETTSHAGNDYSTFMLNDADGCGIMIFTWGHPALSNGGSVQVDGVFEVEHHQGKYTFYNEFQATSVSPGR